LETSAKQPAAGALGDRRGVEPDAGQVDLAVEHPVVRPAVGQGLILDAPLAVEQGLVGPALLQREEGPVRLNAHLIELQQEFLVLAGELGIFPQDVEIARKAPVFHNEGLGGISQHREADRLGAVFARSTVIRSRFQALWWRAWAF
jgi:hypothetical protein